MSEENSSKDQGLLAMICQVRPVIMMLVICFAMSSWIDLYGVWVEVPIFVHILPEGWNFPSYLNVMLQLSNIISMTYGLINKSCAGNLQKREVIGAYTIMGIGLTSLILLIFFWDYTAWIAGAERSVAILSLVFFLALVDNTSKLVYLPYMARFPQYYMPAYVAGEDFGGFVSGIMGIIQGVGGESVCYNHTEWIYNETTGENYTETSLKVSATEPRFSVSVFFLFLAFIVLISLMSFSILNFSTFARQEMIDHQKSEQTSCDGMTKESAPNNIYVVNEDIKQVESQQQQHANLKNSELYLCMFFMFWGAFTVFGLFFSFQSFSVLPYGALAYTLAVRFTTVCNPLASLTAYLIALQSFRGLGVLTGITTVLFGYLLTLAIMSPTPPLTDNALGGVLAAGTMVLAQSLFCYSRACVSTLLNQRGGHRGLFYCGLAIQLGTFIGGVLGFILTSVLHVFESLPPCYEQ